MTTKIETDMGLVRIQVELEAFGKRITSALLQRMEDYEGLVEKALSKVCTEQFLQRVIEEHVSEVISRRIRESLDRYSCASELGNFLVEKTAEAIQKNRQAYEEEMRAYNGGKK